MTTQTALLSVYHKEGIVEFAKALATRGWQILASGGTAKTLREGNISVRDIGDIVGEPILGHRVVTLSREIHAGILARNLAEDDLELRRLELPRINLVCVDFYPLEAEVAAPTSTRKSVIEMTDVGGPTLLHSAAKGERIVICDPVDRMKVIEWFDQGRPNEQAFVDHLDAKADAAVAYYCLISSRHRSNGGFDGMIGERVQICKYGENAWQTPAALFRVKTNDLLAISNFRIVAGDTPSYNNLCDIDRMLQTMTHLIAAFCNSRTAIPIAAVGVKHGNPCGAAIGNSTTDIVAATVAGDMRAIFGGLVMTTFVVDEAVAESLLHAHMALGTKRLLDGVIAPSFTDAAIEMLARKGGKCRLIANPVLKNLNMGDLNQEPKFRQVRGGFLLQPNYTYVPDLLGDPRIARYGEVTREQEADFLLAWAIGSTSNSNTVTLAKERQLIGNGVGQQDRVSCCELAVKRARDAGHDTRGAVAYSDSFFPFPDGPEVLANAGISAILTSSGSVRDDEVKALCKRYDVSLVMIPDAVGRGFFNH